MDRKKRPAHSLCMPCMVLDRLSYGVVRGQCLDPILSCRCGSVLASFMSSLHSTTLCMPRGEDLALRGQSVFKQPIQDVQK